jgi:hypothetical protein
MEQYKRRSAVHQEIPAEIPAPKKEVPAFSANKFKLPDEHLHRIWFSRNKPLEYLIHWNACLACQEEVLDPLGSPDSEVTLTR